MGIPLKTPPASLIGKKLVGLTSRTVCFTALASGFQRCFVMLKGQVIHQILCDCGDVHTLKAIVQWRVAVHTNISNDCYIWFSLISQGLIMAAVCFKKVRD